MAKIVGIDLGTTFSAIAHINKYGEPAIIPNSQRDRLTPSVIQFPADRGSQILVGKPAVQNALVFPNRTFAEVKGKMGTSTEEFFRTSKRDDFSDDFSSDQVSTLKSVGVKSAAELSAHILQKLKQDAEGHLRMEGEISENEDITGACITVPTSFPDSARRATRDAAKIAGFEEVTLIDEPIASAYSYRHLFGKDQNVLVADLGGGTNDISLLKISGKISDPKIEVVDKNTDRNLGGRNFDRKIITHVLTEFTKQHGPREPERTPEERLAVQRLVDDAIRAKEVLSASREETKVIYQNAGKSISVSLTRQGFEELTKNLVKRYKEQYKIALQRAKMEWDAIDTVLLVGGSSRMPMIQEAAAEVSGKEINLSKVDLDASVALGAAIRGEHVLNPSQVAPNKPKPELINIASDHLGVVIYDDKREKYVVDLMVEAGQKIPCNNERDYWPQRAAGQEKLAVNLVTVSIVQGLEQGALIDIDKLNDDLHLVGSFPLKMPQGAPATAKIQLVWKYNADEIVEVEARGPDGRTEKVVIDTPGLDPEEVKEAAGFLQRQEIA